MKNKKLTVKERKEAAEIFCRLNAEGKIFPENGVIIGIASDGKEVEIGLEFDTEKVFQYLLANPTPDKW